MKHPCMTVWPEKFFADTSHISPAAAAFYMILLMQAWARGGSLPNDHKTLRLMCRASRQQWAEVRNDILAFWFVGEDGRLHQKRLDIEWRRAEKRRPEETKSLENLPSRVSGINEKNADTLNGKKPNGNNGTHPASRARARPLPLTENSLPLSGRESSLSEAQPSSEPAAPLRSLEALATRPAPNTALVRFLRQGSPEWLAHEAATGRRLKAYSMHDGDPGQWVKA